MKRITARFAIFLIALISTAFVARAQGSDHGSHDAGAHGAPAAQTSGHEGMSMETGGTMIMLDTVTTDGIKAMAHLQRLNQQEATAAQHSRPETLTFMVSFEEEGKGTAVKSGRVAVKLTGPDGKTGNAITLSPKDGYFKADLELKNPGHYAFEVGSKLADGKLRKFGFSFELK